MSTATLNALALLVVLAALLGLRALLRWWKPIHDRHRWPNEPHP